MKAPLVYTHVAIKNWTAFQKLGIRHIEAPGSYHTYAALDFPVSLGEYLFLSETWFSDGRHYNESATSSRSD